MRRAIAVLSAGLVVLANASAHAAVLNGVYGQALVNRGNGYELAANGVHLKPGDMVVVNPGGGAQISYPDGCTVPIQIGAVITVGESSPCDMTTGAVETESAPRVNGLMVAGALVVGGVGLAVILNNTHKDKPASP